MLSTTPRTALAGFLASLTPAECEGLIGCARPRRFGRGAILVEEGEEAHRVAAFVAGRAKVACFADTGREIVLGALGPGDLVGELSAVTGEPCSATVIALEPVEALVVRPADFIAFLDTHPRVSRIILGMVSRKLRDADRKRVEFGTQDAEGRVARRLVELAREYGTDTAGTVRITLPLSQQELAGWTCSSREAVSKALRSLRACGWVDTGRRCITILDVGALSRRAGVYPVPSRA